MRLKLRSDFWYMAFSDFEFKLFGVFNRNTPHGIREFGLSGLPRSELVRFYPEIAAAQGRCRFGDCSHTHEPGCAVQVAVQQNHISQDRYHSYRVIYRSLAE